MRDQQEAGHLEDGRLELDTNPVENQIRKIALTRKNALFAGHEVGAANWAMLASLIANCKTNDIDPVRYLVPVHSFETKFWGQAACWVFMVCSLLMAAGGRWPWRSISQWSL